MTLVHADRFDRAAFATVEGALSGLVEAGRTLLPDLPELVEELFYVFYKAHTVFSPAAEVPPAARVRFRLLHEVTTAGRFEQARARTLLDAWGAAAAARVLAKRVLSLIRRRGLLLPEEIAAGHAVQRAEEAAADAQAQWAAVSELDNPDPSLAAAVAAGMADRAAEAAAAGEIAGQAARDLPASALGELRSAVGDLPDQLTRDAASAEQFVGALAPGAGVDAAARFALGERLAASEQLRKLAMLVGALRTGLRVRRRRRVPRRGAEVFSVERGADPARLLPTELAALRHPLLKRDARRRFVERGLLQYRLRGDDDRDRGPVVACLDISGSMQGPKELWAKAVTLALFDEARRRRRPFRLIAFSAPPAPMHISDLVLGRSGPEGRRPPDLEALTAFAELPPRGGTEFAPPLEAALSTLAERPFRRGDVVFLTDGEARLTPEFLQGFEAEKRRLGFRVHGVLVDAGPSQAETLAAFSDEVRRVSRLTTDAALDLIESI